MGGTAKAKKGTAKAAGKSTAKAAEKGSSKNGLAQAKGNLSKAEDERRKDSNEAQAQMIGKETNKRTVNKMRADKSKRQKAKAQRLSRIESVKRSDNEKKL